MNVADDCRSELLVGARRGRLSDAGRIALEAHLATCASCRMSREVSADFDGAEAVDLQDGARIRALADRARGQFGQFGQVGGAGRVGQFDKLGGAGRSLGRAPARLRAIGAAAALVLLCGSASAAVWWMRRPSLAPARPVAAPLSTTRAAPGMAVRSQVPATVTSAVVTTPSAPPASATSVRQRPRPVLRAVAETRAGALPPFVSSASATSLLQQATEARQRDDRARAAELYRRLQREFPASAEAVLSAVSLGGLLLEDGLPRAALTEFDGYLAKAHGGALIPEALYGRARALGRLGDRAEERQTWTRLCADFPDSAYASLGRHRLAEIE
jgi:TolA-binding protein